MTLFELTVVNNWYITMVRSNIWLFSCHFSAVFLLFDSAVFAPPQEGVTSMTSHWSRLYFMTFYIVTMVRPGQGFLCAWVFAICSVFPLNYALIVSWEDLVILGLCPLQVVMTIIVAFILDAFVFRMNYSRKNREPVDNPEGLFSRPWYNTYV